MGEVRPVPWRRHRDAGSPRARVFTVLVRCDEARGVYVADCTELAGCSAEGQTVLAAVDGLIAEAARRCDVSLRASGIDMHQQRAADRPDLHTMVRLVAAQT